MLLVLCEYMHSERFTYVDTTLEHEVSIEECGVLRNQMALKLCARQSGFDPDSVKMTSWIDQFGVVFDEYVRKHPETFRQYERDPDGTLDTIEVAIYKV